MVSEKNFFDLAEQKLSKGESDTVSSKIFGTGYFITIKNECAIIQEEFDCITRLPYFITDLISFLALEEFIDSSYKNGFQKGHEELQKNINLLLNGIKKNQIQLDEVSFYSDESIKFLRIFDKNLKNKTLKQFKSEEYGEVFFISVDGESVFINKEQKILSLPDFIKNEDDFSSILKYLNNAYSKGFKDGENELRNNLGKLLGFASKKSVDKKVDILHNRLDNFFKNE